MCLTEFSLIITLAKDDFPMPVALMITIARDDFPMPVALMMTMFGKGRKKKINFLKINNK